MARRLSVRRVSTGQITQTVAELCLRANTKLRGDVYQALARALSRETNPRARRIIQILLENADCAQEAQLAICQDTGLAYIFVELGQQVLISGGDFRQALDKGIDQGYKQGALRNSIIQQPLRRMNGPGFSPGIVHIDIVPGKRIKLTVLPKGFGSENKAVVQMFKPTASIDQVQQFVVGAVERAGADACPPFIVGVGAGGGLDQAALLAKKALLRPLNSRNRDRFLAQTEKALLRKINQLHIGPLGLGGRSTCLGVNILTCPTHIAGLPVAVNISCHALRSATRII